MKFFKDVLLAGSCLLVALLVIEFAMQAAGVHFEASFYTSDPDRGYAHRPNAEGWNVTEHDNFVRINSRGLRDREHDLIRPANTIRIAVIGASESEAIQVPEDKTYWSVLERSLNDGMAGGSKVEVINFGVGGYSLAPQYFTLKNSIWQYDPQIVLVVNSIDSIILRTSRPLFSGDPYGAPFFELRNGVLQLDAETVRQKAMPGKGATRSWTADVMNHSTLLSLINSSRVKAGNDVLALLSRFHAHAAEKSALPEDYWKTWGFLGPANPELKSAWALSEAVIRQMRDEAAKHNVEFWMCTINTPDQADPDPRRRAELQARLGLDSLFRSNDLLSEFLAREGIRSMDLSRDMQRFAEDHQTVLHGFPGTPRNAGHYNETGHEALGRMLAARLRIGSAQLAGSSLQANGLR